MSKQRPLYFVWAGMKQRCYNPKHTSYRLYGGRGITVCERWFNSSEAFYADMGPRPAGMTIDRIDNNGHYTPNNCRWATMKEQQQNRRRSGPRAGLGSRAAAAGVPYRLAWRRIHALGWTEERALSTPSLMPGPDCLAARARAAGLNYQTVRTRIGKLGWSVEKALSTPLLGTSGPRRAGHHFAPSLTHPTPRLEAA